jgi:hypothetical protein
MLDEKRGNVDIFGLIYALNGVFRYALLKIDRIVSLANSEGNLYQNRRVTE